MDLEKYEKFLKELENYKDSVIYVVGHKNEDVDSLVSCYLLNVLLKNKGFNCKIAVHSMNVDPLFKNQFNNITNSKFENFEDIKNINKDSFVILVDHHGLNYKNYNVIGFIDHHFDVSVKEFRKRYNIINDNLIINEKSSANAYIIYKMMKLSNIKLSIQKDNLLLTLLAMYCDTDAFTSTKTSLLEEISIKKAIFKNVKQPNLYIEEFEKLGYGLTDLSLPFSNILDNGKKVFSSESITIVSSYIHIESYTLEKPLEALVKDLISNIKTKCFNDKSHNLFCRVLIIKDFSNLKTYEYDVFKNKVITKKYDKIISRGNDIMPNLIKELEYYKSLQSNYSSAVKKIYSILNHHKIQISTMESCTSGLIASSLTDTEGASSIIKGSLITYSNESKMMFGVQSQVIKTNGVYSFETAEAMAKNTRVIFRSDIGVGITGSFGNIDQNNPDSKSGEIYLSINKDFNAHNIKIYIDCTSFSTRDCQKREVADISMSYLYSLL